MKQHNITLHITEATPDELSAEQSAVVKAARRATYRSYAPYSNFHVGAAILLDNGEIITGANQENVAFPSGLCAERTACFYAGSQYPDARFKIIAIAARGLDGVPTSQPISPCGACRQSLLEYETRGGEDIQVILAGADKVYIIPSIASTLPLSFTDF